MRKLPTLLVCALLLLGGCVHKAPPANDQGQRPVEEIIPLTDANMHGHKLLYDEGWFVVSSTKKSLEYAKNKSIKSSKGNLRRIARDVVSRSNAYTSDVNENWSDSYKQAEAILKSGTKNTGNIISGALDLTADEYDYARASAVEAYQTFVYGNISLVKKTKADFRELKNVQGNYFKDLKDDYSNVAEISAGVSQAVSDGIDVSWEASFNEAAKDFHAEYEESGTRSNSLSALGDILSGYLKALYSGLAKPAAKSVMEYGARGATYGVFLPGALLTVVSGHTIKATGLTLYYAAQTGYHIITPTVESGFMAGTALLSMTATPVTLAAGAGLGAINQVAFTAASPAYGVGKGVTDTAVDSGKYVALVSYDVTKHNSRVLINYMSSAVVLGYNAMTAIPVHLILGTVDSAVFLAWDGPRLVVAVASGKVKSADGDEEISIGDLPTGTVVDLRKLRQQPGVSVKTVTDDPFVINKIFEKMPEDFMVDAPGGSPTGTGAKNE